MDTQDAPAPTAPVGRARPGTSHIAVVIGILVIVSILKPWGGSPAPDEARPAQAAAPGEHAAGLADPRSGSTTDAVHWPAETAGLPQPSPRPDQIACPAGSWQVVSLDRLADWTVRTWTPALPVTASGPLDRSIPDVVLESPAVLALGTCAPGIDAGAASTGIRTSVVAAWRRDGTRLREVALEPRGPGDTNLALATLYRPVAGGGPGGAWLPGRYVIRLAVGDGSGDGDRAAPAWFLGLVVPDPG